MSALSRPSDFLASWTKILLSTSFRKRRRYENRPKASKENLRFVAEVPGVKGAPQNRRTCNAKGFL